MKRRNRPTDGQTDLQKDLQMDGQTLHLHMKVIPHDFIECRVSDPQHMNRALCTFRSTRLRDHSSNVTVFV